MSVRYGEMKPSQSKSGEKVSKQEEKLFLLAEKIMAYARDSILINMRFLNQAAAAVSVQARKGMQGAASDGRVFYYDPVWLLKQYQAEPAFALRLYLHMLFHGIFYHSFQYEQVEHRLWDLSADIAVENTILELGLLKSTLKTDEAMERKLRVLKEELSFLTAEKIYRYLKNNGIGEGEYEELRTLFYRDAHSLWEKQEELSVTKEQWKKISERIKADLKAFSKGRTTSESLEKNLSEAVKERYDYAALLKRFMVRNEEMQVNEEEFDYIYYTYGLERYGNMPLIEPLEYKDSKKIRDFVIAIDTSASCRGPVVQEFLQKTYSILTGEDTFFKKMNVHIIQCDSQVQKDTKITSQEDFLYFISHEKLSGFGSTDFRPVFAHVETLLSEKKFEDLKGLIYFTDGYGIYPDRMPPYDVMFVFPDNGDEGPEVPPWAVKVMLQSKER